MTKILPIQNDIKRVVKTKPDNKSVQVKVIKNYEQYLTAYGLKPVK